eukprot:76773_1
MAVNILLWKSLWTSPYSETVNCAALGKEKGEDRIDELYKSVDEEMTALVAGGPIISKIKDEYTININYEGSQILADMGLMCHLRNCASMSAIKFDCLGIVSTNNGFICVGTDNWFDYIHTEIKTPKTLVDAVNNMNNEEKKSKDYEFYTPITATIAVKEGGKIEVIVNSRKSRWMTHNIKKNIAKIARIEKSCFLGTPLCLNSFGPFAMKLHMRLSLFDVGFSKLVVIIVSRGITMLPIVFTSFQQMAPSTFLSSSTNQLKKICDKERSKPMHSTGDMASFGLNPTNSKPFFNAVAKSCAKATKLPMKDRKYYQTLVSITFLVVFFAAYPLFVASIKKPAIQQKRMAIKMGIAGLTLVKEWHSRFFWAYLWLICKALPLLIIWCEELTGRSIHEADESQMEHELKDWKREFKLRNNHALKSFYYCCMRMDGKRKGAHMINMLNKKIINNQQNRHISAYKAGKRYMPNYESIGNNNEEYLLFLQPLYEFAMGMRDKAEMPQEFKDIMYDKHLQKMYEESKQEYDKYNQRGDDTDDEDKENDDIDRIRDDPLLVDLDEQTNLDEQTKKLKKRANQAKKDNAMGKGKGKRKAKKNKKGQKKKNRKNTNNKNENNDDSDDSRDAWELVS